MRRSLPLLLSILSSVFGGQNNTKVGAEGGAGGGRVGLPINILLSKIIYKQTVDTEEERRGEERTDN